MTHLSYGHGEWRELTPPFGNGGFLGDVVTPKAGDTFSDFTSHPMAVKRLREQGLDVKVQRTAMWGEKDYTIA